MLEGLQNVLEETKVFISEKPLQTAAIGVAAVGTGVGIVLLSAKKKNKVKRKTKRGRRRDIKFISRQKHEIRRRRKRKPAKIYKKKGKYWSRKPLRKNKKRTGKTYYTKKGQPYKILASGKARFIKKTKGRKR